MDASIRFCEAAGGLFLWWVMGRYRGEGDRGLESVVGRYRKLLKNL
jgi:hypothetical protein